MDKHIIHMSKDKTCSHGEHRPPFGSWGGRDGEMRQCPSCDRWFYKKPGYTYIWERVGFFDFARRKAIREHQEALEEQEISERMLRLIKSRDKLEDD